MEKAPQEEARLYKIEDDLKPDWIKKWAEQGIDDLGEFLAKQLAFVKFLESNGQINASETE